LVNRKAPANPERSFGISVGGVLCAVALILAWRGRIGRAEWTGAIGAALLVCGLVRPTWLEPLSDRWWKLSAWLAWVNARVLLVVIFVLVLTPLGLVWRLTGKDPLARQLKNWGGWAPYPSRYKNKRHFARMF